MLRATSVLRAAQHDPAKRRHAADALAWWPAHMASAEDVDVQMVDCLAAVGPGVYDDSVAVIETGRARERGRGGHEATEDLGVLFAGFGMGRDVGLGDEQQVNGSLGMDVGKGERVLVFVDPPGWNLPAHDPAEDAIGGHMRRVYLRAAVVRQSCAPRVDPDGAKPRGSRRGGGSGTLEFVRNHDGLTGECA